MTPWLNVVIWVVLGSLAAVSASLRGRSPLAWFLIGSLLGWYGLLLLFILPPISAEGTVPSKPSGTPALAPKIPAEQPQEFAPAGEWYFLDGAKTICGPLTPQMLKDKWKNGVLFSETWVWSDSIVDWKKIAQVQLLLDWLRK